MISIHKICQMYNKFIKLIVMSNQNLFFQRNTVSSHLVDRPVEVIKPRSKRATSVACIKVDPSKFQHREVFDSKIYQKVNFFKLGLKELRQTHIQKQITVTKVLQSILGQLQTLLGDKGYSQLANNFTNHWKLLPQSQIKMQVFQSISQMLCTMIKKMKAKVEILVRSKTQAEEYVARLLNDVKIKKKEITMPKNELVLMARSDKEKDLIQKNNYLDFALKKEMLRAGELQQMLKSSSDRTKHLQQQNKVMQKEKESQSNYKEMMEYKVKRLKEELEVANYLKDQSMSEKMKYIMNW